MINSFLVTLFNSGTQPTNPASTVGDVLWPAQYQPRTFTAVETAARGTLIGGNETALKQFLACIQLLWVVQESVLADRIVLDDPRISYSQAQLVGQFVSTDYNRTRVDTVLRSFDDLDALQFLTGDLLEVYRSALSRMDKLAAVIAHFGARP